MKKKLLVTAPFSFMQDLLNEIKLNFDVYYDYQPNREKVIEIINNFQPQAFRQFSRIASETLLKKCLLKEC